MAPPPEGSARRGGGKERGVGVGELQHAIGPAAHTKRDAAKEARGTSAVSTRRSAAVPPLLGVAEKVTNRSSMSVRGSLCSPDPTEHSASSLEHHESFQSPARAASLHPASPGSLRHRALRSSHSRASSSTLRSFSFSHSSTIAADRASALEFASGSESGRLRLLPLRSRNALRRMHVTLLGLMRRNYAHVYLLESADESLVLRSENALLARFARKDVGREIGARGISQPCAVAKSSRKLATRIPLKEILARRG